MPACTVEHPRTWDLYTDTLTYVYNTQVHRVTGLSTFKLVLSRSPPPVAVEPQQTDKYPSPANHYLRWKKWLTNMVPVAKTYMARAQLTYKRNFDAISSLEKGKVAFVRK